MSENQKPIEEWTHEELMQQNAWLVIEGITKGEKILSMMYAIFNRTVNWQKAQINSINLVDICKSKPDPNKGLPILVKTAAAFQILVWHNGRKRWENSNGEENRAAICRWTYLQ